MNNDPLVFEFKVAHDKPSSFRKDKSNVCPFCNVKELENIYLKKGPMIWLKNKFPTLRDTWQTVLIESNDHRGDISNYTRDYNRQLMRFSLECFKQAKSNPNFRSVLWYKNFGPKSNGSLIHPHMQIVALEKENGYKYVHENNFSGVKVFQQDQVEVNFALHPIQGFQEININLFDLDSISNIKLWADWIQNGVRYTLEKMYNGRCDSYNLFFYPYQTYICCKIIPRFYAPPYFVGYKLSQVNDLNTLEIEAKNLRNFGNYES